MLFATAIVLTGIFIRWSVTNTAGLSEVDLNRYEAAFGVDLPDWYGDHPFFLYWSLGDGQAFVTLAADPVGENSSQLLGSPAYRFSRIGFSLVGRVAVGWRLDLIPIGLFAANTASLFVIGLFAGTRASRSDPTAVLLAANPAVYIGYVGDSAEPFAIALLLCALTALSRARSAGSAFALATVRPSYLTTIFASRFPLSSFAAAMVAAASVSIVGTVTFGPPTAAAGAQFTAPLLGFFRAWGSAEYLGRLSLLAILLAVAVSLGVALKRSDLAPGTRISLALTALVLLNLNLVVLTHSVNSLRAAGSLPVLLAIALGSARHSYDDELPYGEASIPI